MLLLSFLRHWGTGTYSDCHCEVVEQLNVLMLLCELGSLSCKPVDDEVAWHAWFMIGHVT